MSEHVFRQATAAERKAMERLLSLEFHGRDELRRQLDSARVAPIDENGSLRFEIAGAAPSPVEARVPVDAVAVDVDGMEIDIGFHVVGGLLHELEIYRVDGAPLRRLPPASTWDVVLLVEKRSGTGTKGD